MPGRFFGSSSYRYGFNGKEKEDGINSDDYDFDERMYSARLGRFFSTDPDEEDYPSQTPYCFASNSPISLIDYNGLGSEPPIWLDLLSTALDFVPVLGDIKNVVEAGVGYDLAGNKLSALDRAMMLIPGGDVARAAAKIAKISAKMAVKHGDQVVSITKKAAKRVARDKTKKAIDKSEEVVIYLRTDLKTGKKYVGQTIKKKFDNEARKIEHQRKNKAEYKMDQLETVDSKMADLAEENWIRKKGGPEIYGGTLENKRYQLNDKDYIKAGGKIERPTGNKRLPQFKKLKKLGNKIKNRLPKKRKYPKRKIRAKF